MIQHPNLRFLLENGLAIFLGLLNELIDTLDEEIVVKMLNKIETSCRGKEGIEESDESINGIHFLKVPFREHGEEETAGSETNGTKIFCLGPTAAANTIDWFLGVTLVTDKSGVVDGEKFLKDVEIVDVAVVVFFG